MEESTNSGGEAKVQVPTRRRFFCFFGVIGVTTMAFLVVERSRCQMCCFFLLKVDLALLGGKPHDSTIDFGWEFWMVFWMEKKKAQEIQENV